MTFAQREPDTDVGALYDRHVTITPLHFDTTCPVTLPRWQQVLEATP
jgi:broad specificity polyphosphatase/5'/3'-nucleotidase SurE